MEVAIVALVLLYLFTRTQPIKYQSGTVTGGNTSTPVPTKNMPAFYQQSNSAPVTQVPLPDSVNQVIERKLGFDSSGLTPIQTSDANATENTSVSAETGLGYANNGLLSAHNQIVYAGAFTEPVPSPSLPVTVIDKAPTYAAPVSVPPVQNAMYQGDAATIAPVPPPQPKLETIVPKIASALVNTSYATESTGLDRPQSFRSLA